MLGHRLFNYLIRVPATQNISYRKWYLERAITYRFYTPVEHHMIFACHRHSNAVDILPFMCNIKRIISSTYRSTNHEIAVILDTLCLRKSLDSNINDNFNCYLDYVLFTLSFEQKLLFEKQCIRYVYYIIWWAGSTGCIHQAEPGVPSHTSHVIFDNLGSIDIANIKTDKTQGLLTRTNMISASIKQTCRGDGSVNRFCSCT